MFTAEQAQGLAMFLTQGIEREFATTQKVLAAMPEDKMGFTLGEKGRSMQDLAWHIVTSDLWFMDGIAGLKFGQDGTTPSPSRAGILEKYAKEFPAGLGRVKAMTPQQLATPIDFYGMMNLPAVAYLQIQSAHSIHHRGQLSLYLRAMNAKVPMIYGPSADEGM